MHLECFIEFGSSLTQFDLIFDVYAQYKKKNVS